MTHTEKGKDTTISFLATMAEEGLERECAIVRFLLAQDSFAATLSADYDSLLAQAKDFFKQTLEAMTAESPELVKLCVAEATDSLCWRAIAIALGGEKYGEQWLYCIIQMQRMRSLLRAMESDITISSHITEEGLACLVLEKKPETETSQETESQQDSSEVSGGEMAELLAAFGQYIHAAAFSRTRHTPHPPNGHKHTHD